MSKSDPTNNVSPLRPTDVYDRSRISVLEELEPVLARGPTILGGEGLTEEQLAPFLAALALNKDLWSIELLDKWGNKTMIFRGNIPPDHLRSK